MKIAGNTQENNQNQVKVRNGGFFIPQASDMYEATGSDRINIENIIYNDLPILDVDLFDVDLSDYKDEKAFTVSEDSVIYKIRENIANWYRIIRGMTIISMLLVLLYLGIKLAIATTAGDKAKYKSMLASWFTSFIIIFFIHYFMIAVIEVNDVLLDTFKGIEVKYTGGLSMYDTIRTRAYSLKLSEGLPATVMYMILIYFLIRFLFIYIKRYFTVTILALMGPVMGVKYAFDKINTGKTGTMGAWMFDFALNVLLQSVHAIIYTVFMAIAFEVGMQSIPGFILSLCILHFIFDAEKIFLNVFKFDNRASSIRDVDKPTNYFLEAYKIGLGLAVFPGVAFGLVKNTTKAVGGFVLDNVELGINAGSRIGWEFKEFAADLKGKKVDPYKSIDVRDKMTTTLKNIRANATGWADDKLYNITGVRSLRLGQYRLERTDKKAYQATKALLDKDRKLRREVLTRNISGGVKSITTMAKLAASIPMMVVDTKEGFTMFTTTISDVADVVKQKPHYGYRTKKQINGRRGRVAAIALTGMAGVAVGSAIDNREQLIKDRKEISKNAEMIANLREARVLESNIDDQVKQINERLDSEKKLLTEDKAKEAEDRTDKLKAAAIKRALDSIMSGRDIGKIVGEYMQRNRIEQLRASDVENIIREFNIQRISREIDLLSSRNESTVKKLRSRVAELEEQLRYGIDKAGQPIKKKTVERQLDKTKSTIARIEAEREITIEVAEAIKKDSAIAEGLLIKKDVVHTVIEAYKKDKKKETIEREDIKPITEMFSKKMSEATAQQSTIVTQPTSDNTTGDTTDSSQNAGNTDNQAVNRKETYADEIQREMPVYASKDEIVARISEEIKTKQKKDKKSDGLDKKETVEAILEVNHNRYMPEDIRIETPGSRESATEGALNSGTTDSSAPARASQDTKKKRSRTQYDEYSTLTYLLRDLESLNQKSKNRYGRSVTDIKKVQIRIKDNNFIK